MKWDFDLLLQVSAAVILLAFSTGYIISLVSRLISTSSKKQTTENEDVSSLTGLKWLSQSIDNPVFYKDPWKKEFDDAVNFIVNDTDEKIEVIYIEGGLGCGKTRAAKEIGHSIKDRYKENNTEAMIFFGS